MPAYSSNGYYNQGANYGSQGYGNSGYGASGYYDAPQAYYAPPPPVAYYAPPPPPRSYYSVRRPYRDYRYGYGGYAPSHYPGYGAYGAGGTTYSFTYVDR
jgi:hypothetical protein